MGHGILITATDTGAGKTYVTCLLGKRLRQEGPGRIAAEAGRIRMCAGGRRKTFPADAAALRDAFAPRSLCIHGLPLSALGCAVSSPGCPGWRAYPSISARIRQTVNGGGKRHPISLLIEGAGGITVEIRDGYSFADLARDLSLPVLIVAGNRLGVLNHLQLTLRYLQSQGIPLFGVILNDLTQEFFPAREPQRGRNSPHRG